MVTNLNLSYPQALGLLKKYCFPPVLAGRVRAHGQGGFVCSCSLLLFAFFFPKGNSSCLQDGIF